MDETKLRNFYQECMNMDLSQLLETISATDSLEEKAFYADLFNFIIKIRQKKCIENGVY